MSENASVYPSDRRRIATSPPVNARVYLRVDLINGRRLQNMRTFCELVVLACVSPAEVTTVKELADHMGLHVRSLERRCQAVGATARDVAAFVACAKIVLSAEGQDWLPSNYFSDKDPRTARKLVELGGLNVPVRPQIGDFVRNQRFLSQRKLQQLLLQRLDPSQDT